MQIMKTLDATSNAIYHDPGSSSGRYDIRAVASALACLKLGNIAIRKNLSQVWINSSIYDTAVTKLMLLLFSLRKFKEPMVRVFFHGGRFSKLRWLHGKFMRGLVSHCFGRADIFHFLSKEQAEDFQWILGIDRWQLFKNFSDSSNVIESATPRKKAFLFVGRLIREKGIREILASIDQLDNQSQKTADVFNYEFWFAGEGPEEEYLRQEAKQRPKGKIVILGRLDRNQLNEVYSKAFALLLPSFHPEGFPYVVIEAMQAGLPIIASPIGAIPDLIKEQKNGLLVPVKDPISLGRAIRRLLDDERLWSRISRNNKEFFLKYLSSSAA
jgi:glycosyltransferase involved in cell wall biosynthesis